jgi:chromatin remodeling complex protein RSC6
MSSSATAPKKTTKKSTATATTATTAAAVAAPAPVIAAPAPVTVASTVVAPAIAAPAPVAAEENVDITAQFTSLVEAVNAARTAINTIHSNMKKLEKQIPRELKKASKGGRRRRAAPADGSAPVEKKPSVFTIPTQISDALATFLGLPKGSLISRAEVTTRVCKYATEKGLMEKQVIKPDATLRKLLNVNESDVLRILNLQKYLSSHYPLSVAAKAAKAAAAATPAAPRA